MRLDGVLDDLQLTGDFLISAALGEQAEHLHFALGQRLGQGRGLDFAQEIGRGLGRELDWAYWLDLDGTGAVP